MHFVHLLSSFHLIIFDFKPLVRSDHSCKYILTRTKVSRGKRCDPNVEFQIYLFYCTLNRSYCWMQMVFVCCQSCWICVRLCLHWVGGGGGSGVGHLSPTVKHLPASPLITTQTHSNILYGPFHHGVGVDSDRGGGRASTLGNVCGWCKMASIFVEKDVDEYSCGNKAAWTTSRTDIHVIRFK